MRQRLAACAHNRLVQFLAIGAAIFAIAPRTSSREIEITQASLRALAAADASKRGAPATDDESLAAIERRAVEDELLFREGVRLGLEDGDVVVRQRVIQKVLFLAEELDGATRTATEGELRDYYAAHPERWQRLGKIRFESSFAHSREALERGDREPGPIPSEMEADETQIAARLGQDAAKAIVVAPIGDWSASFASPYGWHRVKVVAREENGGLVPFEEVRARVAEAYSVWKREEAVAKFLSKAAERYRITIDGKAAAPSDLPRRIAARAELSGED